MWTPVEGQAGKLNMTQLMNEIIVIFVVSFLLQGLLYYLCRIPVEGSRNLNWNLHRDKYVEREMSGIQANWFVTFNDSV